MNKLLLALAASCVLAACGGGNGQDPQPTVTPVYPGDTNGFSGALFAGQQIVYSGAPTEGLSVSFSGHATITLDAWPASTPATFSVGVMLLDMTSLTYMPAICTTMNTGVSFDAAAGTVSLPISCTGTAYGLTTGHSYRVNAQVSLLVTNADGSVAARVKAQAIDGVFEVAVVTP
ncbi:MAG TPA: hypothetical protein PLL72_03840 [Burkholderiaceae bacterium]|nr:hypothetical protein [Burkholderiaceae bacterium]